MAYSASLTRLRRVFKRKRVSRSTVGQLVVFIFVFGIGLFIALPLVYMIGNSFKPLNELWIFPPPLFPQNPTMQNFKKMFELLTNSWVPITRYIFNTVFVTAVGSVLHILLVSLCAYPLAKHPFPGRKMVSRFISFSIKFSGAVLTIPSYIIIAKLNWLDTYQAMILPAVGSTLGCFLMVQFMGQIHDSLLEAAKIDGSGEWRIFFTIVMPMVKPAWLTLLMMSVQTFWNMSAGTLIFSEQLKTLPYAASQIVAGGIARAGVGSALMVFMLTVPLIVFLKIQSNIIQTLSSSGIKE